MLTDITGADLTKKQLYKASPAAVLRLANYLHLNVDGMGHEQIARLIYWRLAHQSTE
jgi:hypothetical protein